MDVLLPPSVTVRQIKWGTIPAAAATANVYTGKTKARALGGDRLACTIDFPVTNNVQRALLLAFIAQLRGPINTALIVDPSYTARGSFVATELLTNPEFTNGTNGYSAGSEAALSVTDGVLRVKRIGNAGSLGVNAYAQCTLGASVQWQSYAWRLHASRVRGTAKIAPNVSGNATVVRSNTPSAYLTAPGYSVAVVNAIATSGITGYFDNVQPGESLAGEFYDIDFGSFSPCGLVDAGVNLLTRSDEFDNTTAWGALPSDGIASVTANAAVAPDGTTTADTLVEDTSTGNHVRDQAITVSADPGDYAFAVAVRQGSRAFVNIAMIHAGGTCNTYFNLTDGSIGTNPTGSGWANQRAYVRDLGTGWYYLCIVARKTSSHTTINPAIYMANTIATNSYLGNGSTMYVWRATCAQSAVPIALARTQGAAAPLGTYQKGTEIRVKGLPVSTDGIRKTNDWVEFNASGLVTKRQIVAPLDSDAAGLGTVFLSQPVTFDLPDLSPVIFHKPMARMRCVSDIPSWITDPGIFSTASLDFEESVNE